MKIKNILKIERILVIDDNDTDLLIASIVLDRSGFKGNLVTKTSARAGLDYLNSLNENLELWPNIIFLDINMPLMNGYGFVEEFEKFSSNLKNVSNIVMLTSSDNKTDLDSFLNKTFVRDYFPKPISTESVQSIFEKLS
ncbi:MAG: response regulator [Cytophagales bacterium]|nr:MAG: response regulator [Cytophagales bacterium]